MLVSIINVTDHPSKQSAEVAVYNKILVPGEQIKLPAELIDRKVRSLEERGLICVGLPPAWYEEFRAKRSRRLTPTEVASRLQPNGKKNSVHQEPEVEPTEGVRIRKKQKG